MGAESTVRTSASTPKGLSSARACRAMAGSAKRQAHAVAAAGADLEGPGAEQQTAQLRLAAVLHLRHDRAELQLDVPLNGMASAGL